MFGSSSSTPNLFGSSFGASTQPQSTSTFGGFGQPAATGTTGFGGFGQQPAASTAPTFGGFGQTSQTTTSGFGSFGQPASTTGSAFGGFGQPSTTGTSAFGSTFGQPASTGFGGFGTQPQQPSTGGFFSNLNQPSQPTSAFGQPQSAFGGFGQPTQQSTSGSMFGQQQQPQAQQGVAPSPDTDYAARLAAAVQNPFIFGDERDQVLAKFNSTLATMGCGKAYYAQNLPPLDLNAENVFCKWKSIVFMPKPDPSTEEGTVRLIFNKSGDAVFEVKKELADLLHKLLGDQPNLSVVVEGVNPLPDNKSELSFHVLQRQPNNTIQRIPSAQLHAFLTQPQQAANLKNMLVEDVQMKLVMTKEIEKKYLEEVPPGISPYAWFQAQKDNPDPENLLPVPIVGFDQMYGMLKKEASLATLGKDTSKQFAAEVKKLERKVEENRQISSTYQDKLAKLKIRQLHVMSSLPVVSRIAQPLSQFEIGLADNVSHLRSTMEGPEHNLKNRSEELAANIQLHDRYISGRSKRQPKFDLSALPPSEQEEITKACELLINVLDSCKEKLREEKAYLSNVLYEDASANFH